VCIEQVSNKKCLDTVSRVVSMKSRYTFDTLRYTSIHLWGKSTPIHGEKGTVPPYWCDCDCEGKFCGRETQVEDQVLQALRGTHEEFSIRS